MAEQRHADQAAWEGELFRLLVENVQDYAIFIVDPEGLVRTWSHGAECLLGYQEDEILGRTFDLLFTPEDVAVGAPRQEMQEALQTGRGVNDRWHVRKDGTRFWSSGVLTPLWDEAGALRGFAKIMRDRTEWWETEQAKRASEARTAAVLETALDAILTIDHEGRIVEFNPAAERMFGYKRAEVMGRDIAQLIIPPRLRDAHHGGMGRDLANGKGPILDRRIETEAMRADGTEFPVELAITRVPSSSPPLFTAYIRDITARKEAEEALHAARRELEARVAERTAQLSAANQFLQAILENVHDGIVACDAEGTLTLFNRATREFHGLPPEPLPPDQWAEHYDLYRADGKTLMSPEEVPLYRSLQGERVQGVEMVIAPKNGPRRIVLASGQAFQDDRGRKLGAVVSMHDITERKEAEAALRQSHEELERRVAERTAELQRANEALRAAKQEAEAANQAKTQFLAVLSHELRTPLNPILMATSALLERPADPEELRPTLEMIRQNVQLQARLIDDLLDVMRIVRGKMPLHWEVADCHLLIDRAVQICRSEVFGGALKLKLDLAATHHHVNADPARLQQVLWNLIKNAVKFTPGGGTITIRTVNGPGPDGPGDYIAIEVSDTGIGIEPDFLPRIFDPFQQGETTITRKYGGLGLGLAICKGVVDAHGGTLSAESKGKNQGTTFRVVLKALPEQTVGGDGQTAGGDRAVAPARPASLRILVVEDEPATLRLMARLLRGLGHVVTTASTIASAYEAFGAGEFDLIVSDIGLPDGTGLELMQRFVALRGPIPSIALTGYGMDEDIMRSRQAGFTAHMTKPIDFTKLETMIRQVATGHR